MVFIAWGPCDSSLQTFNPAQQGSISTPSVAIIMKLIAYGAYVWLPVVTALGWLVTLVGLMTLWLLQDHGRKYQDHEASIVFISDVGAAHLSWFIPGCALVFFFYGVTLISERWLRSLKRIPNVIHQSQKFWGYSTVILGILGGFCLMMLALLNTFDHPTAHWTFTLLFMICVSISSISQIMELYCLRKDYPNRTHLKRNAFLKSLIIFISFVLGVLFGSLYVTCGGYATSHRCDVLLSTAAVCEWIVAFLIVFYFLTFSLDFLPAITTSPKSKRHMEWGPSAESEKSDTLHGTPMAESTK